MISHFLFRLEISLCKPKNSYFIMLRLCRRYFLTFLTVKSKNFSITNCSNHIRKLLFYILGCLNIWFQYQLKWKTISLSNKYVCSSNYSIIMETRTHIDEPYVLKEEQIQFYNTYRYIKLKHVLDEDSLAYFNTIISEKVEALNQENTPLKNRSTYG